MSRDVHQVSLADDVLKENCVLEEGMWRSETIFDRLWFQVRFHPEFVEIGHLGRIYGNKEILKSADEPSEIYCGLPLPNFKAAGSTLRPFS